MAAHSKSPGIKGSNGTMGISSMTSSPSSQKEKFTNLIFLKYKTQTEEVNEIQSLTTRSTN
jgi:hypothetical protein